MSRPLRVLIVEDSEDDALIVLRELRRSDFDATFVRVETPAALAAALDGQTWDVVLSDYSMPHFSGLAALALLKEKALDVPFVIVSGTIGEDTAVAAWPPHSSSSSGGGGGRRDLGRRKSSKFVV